MNTRAAETSRVTADQPEPGEAVIIGSTALAFLRTRRSPKLSSLSGPAPSDSSIREMLVAASRVPDHGRLVPWRFVVVRGDRRIDLSAVISNRFDELHPEATEERRCAMQGRLAKAPLVIAVVFSPKPHPKIPQWEQELTVGAVCMNLLHAARAMRLGGLWLTEWYASDRAVLRELGLTGDERIAGFIHIGTPTEARDDRARPELDDIVSEY